MEGIETAIRFYASKLENLRSGDRVLIVKRLLKGGQCPELQKRRTGPMKRMKNFAWMMIFALAGSTFGVLPAAASPGRGDYQETKKDHEKDQDKEGEHNRDRGNSSAYQQGARHG